MKAMIEHALQGYEGGRITRRQLVATLATLVTGSATMAQGDRSPIAARTLNHVTLRVSNVDRSVRFYQQLFGFPIANRQQSSVGLGVGTSHIGLSQGPTGEQPQINHFCFGVQGFDVDRVIATLGAHGVTGSVRMRGDVKELYFTDPDNIRVQLQDESYHG